MARIFGGITLAALVALCIACGGAGTPPITTSTSHTPPDSAAVDRPAGDSPADSPGSQALQAKVEQYSQVMEAAKQWIRDGEPPIGSIRVGAIGSVGSVEIFQIVSSNTALCRLGRSGQLVMVRGYDMTDNADGQHISLPLVRVTGTDRYVTNLNATNTVFVLESVDIDEARLELKYEEERAQAERLAEAQKQAEAERESQFRDWISADGQFTIEARLDRLTAGQVTLEKRDGSTVDVPEEKLSEADRAYIDEEFKRRAKAKRAIERTREGA